jgi:hypothetical protein
MYDTSIYSYLHPPVRYSQDTAFRAGEHLFVIRYKEFRFVYNTPTSRLATSDLARARAPTSFY